MFSNITLTIVLSCVVCVLCLPGISAEKEHANTANTNSKDETIQQEDLATSGTSAKLFNLGSLFGQNPSYPYGNGYGSGYGYGYGNNYYPSTYRPNTYYPTTNTYPSSGYYPTRNNYYPSSSGWSGSNYPNYGYNGVGYGGSYGGSYGNGYNYGTGYNSAGTAGYYPTTGTNILGGNGGYGGYGGNGGLNQYYGYLNPLYSGQRNRGYGYYADTDRYGLPRYDGGYNDRPYAGRGGLYGAYRGYD